jgi:hypothetical protein
MSLPWFRMYHRMVDDEKLRLLAFEDRWHFVALCCLKADGLLDEPCSDLRSRKIAVKLGVQVRELEEIGRRLSEVGLVDETLSPLAWDELQKPSDSSTERSRKHREKARETNAMGKRNADATLQKRSRNALDTDTDRDTDKEREEPKGSSASGDAPPTVDEVVEAWNETAAKHGLAQIRKLTDIRRKKVQAQLRRFGLSDWQAVFAKISQSPFLLGQTGDWRCDFDFILSENNFVKILEGKYDRQSTDARR